MSSGRAACSLALACISVVAAVGTAHSQGLSCPYRGGLSQSNACSVNPAPSPIPSGMGGSRMTAGQCGSAVKHAVASLYSYDDAGCHSANSSLVAGTQNLKIVREQNDFFTAILRRLSLENNFHGTVYCESSSNTLILAFRGSVALTPLLDSNQVDDWFRTNFLQHLGERPLQYELAEAAADTIESTRALGAFDGSCGSGRPTLMLAGHSKGGGQAQFAATRLKLKAVVFNSDMVNPIIFSDAMQAGLGNLVARPAASILGCRGRIDPSLAVYSAYFMLGNVEDVRMANDPLTDGLYRACGNNLPHAPIEWLINTLSCSGDGHAIETVFRQLQVCIP
jgi:hypothetical protein